MYSKCFCFIFGGCPCMAINNVSSVQHNNGGFLPDIILLTQCHYHRGTRLIRPSFMGIVFGVYRNCVCVCFLPIHSGHQVCWTYQPGSHRRKVTQDFYWIGEFGDLKSDTPILWGSIWPNTIISNPIFYFFPRLHRIWNPNTMESRTIVFAVFDLTCRRVPLKVRSHHQA